MQSTGDPAFRQVLASVTTRLPAAYDRLGRPPEARQPSRDEAYGHRRRRLERNADRGGGRAAGWRLARLGSDGVSVSLTGASGMWSDFNEANKEAMLKSELISWPVTLAILVVAFGSLVAAGLPLLLTILGLVASAGLLWVLTHGFDISIWAMNFALMFALALGIDYALFVVHRFRGAYFGSRLPARGGDRRNDGHRRQGRPLLRPDRADLPLRGDARSESGLPLDGARDRAQASSSSCLRR